MKVILSVLILILSLAPKANAQTVIVPEYKASAAAPALAEGKYYPGSVDLNGNLRVIVSGSSGGYTNVKLFYADATPTPFLPTDQAPVTATQLNATDKSGAVTLGGTAQVAVAANTSRRRISIQNYSTATAQNIVTAESLWVSFTGTALCGGGLGTIEIPSGTMFDSGLGPVSTQAVSVCGATTNHKWYAAEQ